MTRGRFEPISLKLNNFTSLLIEMIKKNKLNYINFIYDNVLLGVKICLVELSFENLILIC